MIELTKTLQKVRDAERDFSIERAKTNQVIAEARLLAEDETASYEERLEALKKANDLEISTTEKAIALQKEKLEAKKAEVEASESLAEDLDEIAALEVELIDMQTASFMKRKRLMTAEETLRTEQQAAANTAAREAQALLDKQAKDREEQAKKERDEELELAKQRELEADQLRIRQEEVALLNIENAQERELQQLEFKMEAEMRAVDGFENAEEQKTLIKAKYTKLRNNLTASEAEFSIANANAAASVVTSSLSTLAANHVQGTKSWKNLKIAEATISGFQAAVNAFKSTSEIPLVGAALAPIAAATALAAMQQQISQIKSTPIPEQKLARGGIVSGMGTGTSDSVRTRLSKGETVINARSSKMFLPLLSQINSAGGGDDFAASGDTALQSEAGAPVVKAYVLADDMSSNQDRLNKIRRRSTL
jgi:DNA repair exonuclease SbcCD ATPase subunit